MPEDYLMSLFNDQQTVSYVFDYSLLSSKFFPMLHFLFSEATSILKLGDKTIHHIIDIMIRAFMFLEFEETEWEILLCTSFLIGAKCHELDSNLPALIEIVYTINAS